MGHEDLSTDVGEFYEQLQGLPEFEDESCREALRGFLGDARRLYDFNQVQSYRVVFIGEPGKGKTTAICNWLGLLRKEKVAAKRVDKVSLLTTASGRTTVAEVRIRQVAGQSRLRIEYMPIPEQESYIRDFAAYYYQQCTGTEVPPDGEADVTDTAKADTHIEMDRVVQNMAGLQNFPSGYSERSKRKRDEIIAFLGTFADEEEFYRHLLETINLQARNCSAIVKDPSEDFECWLSEAFQDVNFGKREDCSIASVIHVEVGIDDLDLMLPDFIAEVIDTKGLDSAAAARLDLQELMRAEDTICFVLDEVKSVPSDNVRNLLRRTYLTNLDDYYKCKTSIFVKSPIDELEGVNGADDDAELGEDIKRNEVDRRVKADGIPYYVENTLFLDSCAAYSFVTRREPVRDANGHEVIDQHGKPKTRKSKVIESYDEAAADEFRCALTTYVVTLRDRLRNRLEEDAAEVRAGVAQLLDIQRRATVDVTVERLEETAKTIEREKDRSLYRFRKDGREGKKAVSEAILKLAIDDIHWCTIRKMNSLYGGYEQWHTDIYTQILQAGRECFADYIRPMSTFIRKVVYAIDDPDARGIAIGCLSQYEQMVHNSTDAMGMVFFDWAFNVGFSKQDDSNPFWRDVNGMRGRGYKNRVRNRYERNIDSGANKLAKSVNDEANRIVDILLILLRGKHDLV